MSQPYEGARDEDAVAEIPPGEERAGSVQGGGSEILAGGDAAGGDTAGGDTAGGADVGTLSPLDVEVTEEDKGATGD
jgi:hypothetical protein